MSGGHLAGTLLVYNDCEARISGGTLGGDIVVGYGHLEILGTNFAIDGVPVASGPVTQVTGTLTGTLRSGDPIDNAYELSSLEATTLTVPEPSWLRLQGAVVASLFVLRSRRRRQI